MKRLNIFNKKIFIYTFLLVALFFVLRTKLIDLKDLEKLENLVRSFGYLAFLAYIFFCIIASFTFIPLVITRLAGALIFGPFIGGILNIIGLTIGSVLCFMTSRYFFQSFFRKKFSENRVYIKINNAFDKYGGYILIGTRLNPVFSNTVQNFLYGLTKIKFKVYLVGSLILYTAGSIIVSLGVKLATTDNLANTKNMYYIILMLILIILIIIFIKKSSNWLDFKKEDAE
ncbi:MAG: TVP38/TMEM64 family protein [Fusobacteriota bacterium]